MAAHLSWRWIVLIMYGDHLKASVSYEEHVHLKLLVQRWSKACPFETADCPLERKDKPWQCLLSLSLTHTLPFSFSPLPSLSLPLSRPLSHIRSAEMHPRAKSHRTTPLSQRKKLESVCPDISPAPARSEGRGKDRGREKGRERGRERGKRLGQRKRDRWENGRPGLYLLGVWVPRCRLWDGWESARCCC